MTAKPLVLIVDDDAELSAMVAALFEREGLAVQGVLSGADGERALAELRPDAVLLDVMLPDANGYELCRRWRGVHPALGIVMFTARGEPMDRVLGLEIGADDYLAKPFEPRELVARVRALLRRQAPGRGDAALLRFEGLAIDLLRREVTAGAQAVSLTGVEFGCSRRWRACRPDRSRARRSASTVQPGSYKPQDRTVDVQVARLRRKLREASPAGLGRHRARRGLRLHPALRRREAMLPRADSLFTRLLLLQIGVAIALVVVFAAIVYVERNVAVARLVAERWAPALLHRGRRCRRAGAGAAARAAAQRSAPGAGLAALAGAPAHGGAGRRVRAPRPALRRCADRPRAGRAGAVAADPRRRRPQRLVRAWPTPRCCRACRGACCWRW